MQSSHSSLMTHMQSSVSAFVATHHLKLTGDVIRSMEVFTDCCSKCPPGCETGCKAGHCHTGCTEACSTGVR